jgi:hypothetical protein
MAFGLEQAAPVLRNVVTRLYVASLRASGFGDAVQVIAVLTEDGDAIDRVARALRFSRSEARRWVSETRTLLSLVPCDGIDYAVLTDRIETLYWVVRPLPETVQRSFDPGSD